MTRRFDTGPDDYAFERNASRLGADLGEVESIVLSYGHWDHAGAVLLALDSIRRRTAIATCLFTPIPACSAHAL
jgi:7,8-dihydropterin-6-yl-methyl-4-(beta-D-ribofuranosyl)aminobenzene 5'-phosphate synthase